MIDVRAFAHWLCCQRRCQLPGICERAASCSPRQPPGPQIPFSITSQAGWQLLGVLSPMAPLWGHPALIRDGSAAPAAVGRKDRLW